jgi:hypothetical protein
MHLIVKNVARRSEIHRVDDLVVSIVLIAVKVLGLAAVSCCC